MKFSNDTLNILKNFSEINSGIHFKKGNSLATYHPQKFVLAEATIEESLPKNFAIYNLAKFLSVTSLFGEPDFEFADDKVVVSKDNRSVNYVYAQPELILDPGKKPATYRQKTLEGKIASATISKEDWASIKQAASVLQLPDIVVQARDGKLFLTAKDTSNSASDSFEVVVDAEVDEAIDTIIKFSYLKLFEGSYDIVLHPQLAYFKHQTSPLEYWVAFHSAA